MPLPAFPLLNQPLPGQGEAELDTSPNLPVRALHNRRGILT